MKSGNPAEKEARSKEIKKTVGDAFRHFALQQAINKIGSLGVDCALQGDLKKCLQKKQKEGIDADCGKALNMKIIATALGKGIDWATEPLNGFGPPGYVLKKIVVFSLKRTIKLVVDWKI